MGYSFFVLCFKNRFILLKHGYNFYDTFEMYKHKRQLQGNLVPQNMKSNELP